MAVCTGALSDQREVPFACGERLPLLPAVHTRRASVCISAKMNQTNERVVLPVEVKGMADMLEDLPGDPEGLGGRLPGDGSQAAFEHQGPIDIAAAMDAGRRLDA